MIGALKGTIYSKSINSVILFTGGVGYTVFVTNTFLEKTPVEKDVFLFIHSHIREDAFDLFGFTTSLELHLFELLLSVSGVGPKTALSVMDKGVVQIQHAIQSSDVDFFTTIPRLGKKNAQKIIIELKSKLGSTTELDLTDNGTSETKELLEGLLSMGFAKSEILGAMNHIPPETITMEQKILICLKHLGKKS
jgi:holliday junction DNA helicase RuvA